MHLGELFASRAERLVDVIEVALAAARFHDRDLLRQRFGLGHLRGVVDTRADRLERVRVELLRFDEHLLAHADLAEVVQERCVLELLHFALRELHAGVRAAIGAIDRLREAAREHAHTKRMAARRRITLLDRLHTRAHEALEDAADLVVQERVLERDAGLARETEQELGAARVEWDDLIVVVILRAQHPARVLLLVDELDDADDLVLGGDHRHRDHRPRVVADALVEGGIVRVGRVGRKDVHVLDVDRALGGRRVARDRAGRDRDRELARLEAARVVLAHLEAEPARAWVALDGLDDVDRARVRARDEAALREDEIEQPIDVALLRDRARDRGELAYLVARAVERGLEAKLAGVELEPLDEPRNPEVQLVVCRVLTHARGEHLRRELRDEARARSAHDEQGRHLSREPAHVRTELLDDVRIVARDDEQTHLAVTELHNRFDAHEAERRLEPLVGSHPLSQAGEIVIRRHSVLPMPRSVPARRRALAPGVGARAGASSRRPGHRTRERCAGRGDV